MLRRFKMAESPALRSAEPLKKKKRIDPAVLRAREDRRKRRLEKEIRRLEKNVLQLKPIDELEVTSDLMKSLESRSRPQLVLTEEETDRRHDILKKWGVYKLQQHQEDFTMINKVLKSKEKALEELKAESEELYVEAIQLDLLLIPFRCKGPVDTPPIKGFDAIDGDYEDVTRKWV